MIIQEFFGGLSRHIQYATVLNLELLDKSDTSGSVDFAAYNDLIYPCVIISHCIFCATCDYANGLTYLFSIYSFLIESAALLTISSAALYALVALSFPLVYASPAISAASSTFSFVVSFTLFAISLAAA